MTHYRQLLEAVGDRLAAITPANGYTTSVGNNCVYRQDLPLDYLSEDGAITWRVPEEGFVGDNQVHTRQLAVEIEAVVFVGGAGLLTDEDNLRADILRVLSTDRTWGGLAKQTNLRKISTDSDTQGKQALRLVAEIDIVTRTRLYEP